MNESQIGQAVPAARKKGMGLRTKLAIGCGGCFGVAVIVMLLIGGLAALSTSGKTAATSSSANDPAVQKQKRDQAFEDFMMKRMDLILKRPRAHSCNVSVKFNKILIDNEVDIDLSYDSMQSPLDVAIDTRGMVRAALDKLIEDGHQPAKEEISVSVSGGMPVKGATGTDRYLPFGFTDYTYYDDSIKFHPWDNIDSKFL